MLWTEGIKDEGQKPACFFSLKKKKSFPDFSCTQNNCDLSAKTSSKRGHLSWSPGKVRVSIKRVK